MSALGSLEGSEADKGWGVMGFCMLEALGSLGGGVVEAGLGFMRSDTMDMARCPDKKSGCPVLM